METRVVYGQMPPTDRHFALKSPYTQYSKPDFTPHHYYEYVWNECVPEKIRIISKIEFPTLEECQKAFEIENKKYLDTTGIISNINNQIEKTQLKARESHRRYVEIMSTDDFYPTALWNYMDRLRRAKYVKEKRKREKNKILSMPPKEAKIYIERKLKEMENDEK